MKLRKINSEELDQIETLFSKGITPIGIDLASRNFQICYVDPITKRLKNFEIANTDKNKANTDSRDRFKEFFTSHPELKTMRVGIEACGACNYFARFITACGHEVKVMQAEKLKKFGGIDKTDKIDALNILKGAFNPSVKNISYRSEENQSLMNLFTTRDQLSKQSTQSLNTIRAMLYEMGEISTSVSCTSYKRILKELENCANSLSEGKEHFILLTKSLLANQTVISNAVKEINEHLKAFAENNETCRNLMTIPGVGVMTAVSIYTYMGDINRFDNSRHFASFLGVTPINKGTGGQTKNGKMRKPGIAVVKKMHIQDLKL